MNDFDVLELSSWIGLSVDKEYHLSIVSDEECYEDVVNCFEKRYGYRPTTMYVKPHPIFDNFIRCYIEVEQNPTEPWRYNGG